MSLSPSWSESNTSKVGGYWFARLPLELVRCKAKTCRNFYPSRAAFIRGPRLLIFWLSGAAFYLRAALIRGRRLFEEIRYLVFFARPTNPPSREGGRWETKHFIGMALVIACHTWIFRKVLINAITATIEVWPNFEARGRELVGERALFWDQILIC